MAYFKIIAIFATRFYFCDFINRLFVLKLILFEPRFVRTVGSSFWGVAQLVEHHTDIVKVADSSSAVPTMNEGTVKFVYIAGNTHAVVDITKEQLNKILSILHGEKG